MPPKRKESTSSKKKQSPITKHVLPLLRKPMETIGKQIDVPGAFWEGRMSEEEKKTKYKCTVRDFTMSHKFPYSIAPEAAVSLQEMGKTGTGSTEHGDASGEIFWMPARGCPRPPAPMPARHRAHACARMPTVGHAHARAFAARARSTTRRS